MREAAADASGEAATSDHKPADVGNGVVCASFGRDASWLSLGTTHAEVGFVELTALPPFDESHRGDPGATRRYRAAMVLERFAVLRVEIEGAPPVGLAMDVTDPERPRWRGRHAGLRLDVEAVAEPSGIRQRWRLESTGARRSRVVLRLRGRLDRPALAEITELEPPQPTGARTVRRASRMTAQLSAPELGVSATIRVAGGGAAWQAVASNELLLTIGWPDGALELGFELSGWVSAARGATPITASDPHGTVRPPAVTARSALAVPDDRLTRRALAYIRGCTALATDRPDERAILTYHRILPLSWTRDAYWQALALLAADGAGDRERVADHLRWLWRRCERPDGRWVRSHHANGLRKDPAFQADQQLYPMIELADFWRLTRTLPDGVDWPIEVGRAWDAALREVDPATGLMGSTENAADDPADAPFIAASQILLWYTGERLAEMADTGMLAMDGPALHAVCASVRSAFDARMASGDGPWAYAVDTEGRRVDYHDANDLPVALAPLLGFCAADDSGWRATMRFAFSPRNPAWFDGPRPGLGSLHTRRPWPLGDIQAWIVGHLTGDPAASANALERLRLAAFADGMLPEARSTGDGARIRHWFAWPGAALAALRLLDEAGRLRERLSARRIP